jgi:hypothetical protein
MTHGYVRSATLVLARVRAGQPLEEALVGPALPAAIPYTHARQARQLDSAKITPGLALSSN